MKSSSLIGHSVEVLTEIDRSAYPPDSIFATFFRQRKYLGSRDRRFISETVYGVLRHRRRLDLILESVPGALEGPTAEGMALLRIAAYLLAAYPDPSATTGDFLMLLGDDSLREKLTFILNRIEAQRGAPESTNPAHLHSFPDWMVDKFRKQTGEDGLVALLEALNRPAPVSLRVNTLRCTVEQCRERLRSEGVEARPAKYSPTGLILTRRVNVFGLGAFKDGWFEVQDEGSQLLPILIDPKPTDRVLDMCAGAGGKSLALSALMKNRGEIIATDVSSVRLKELRRRAIRAGVDNVRVREELLEGDALQAEEPFDVVFVDAPCTGVGTIRRNPGMKWSVTEQMVKELAEKQLGILRRAAEKVKSGGRLVYATCSLFSEENEDIVEAFLAASKDFRREGDGGRFQTLGITDAVKNLDVYLSPGKHDTDGFYCAFLKRM